jgi:hypothetical protein
MPEKRDDLPTGTQTIDHDARLQRPARGGARVPILRNDEFQLD